jgi:hypothetical protein
MNWEAIGTLVEAIGVIAVVATLFYLSIQIRQSTNQGRRNELNANLEQAAVFRMALAENQDLAELWIIGLNDYDSLSEVHKIRFDSLMGQRFWIWNHIFDRMMKGYSQKHMWNSGKYQIRNMLTSAGARLWWSRNYGQFPQEFVEEINALLDSEDGT